MLDFTGMQPRAESVVLPDGTKYILREPSGEADIAHHRAMYGAVNVDGELNKVDFMQHVKEAEAVLVAHCMFPVDSDIHVTVEFVKALPRTIYKKLLQWVESTNEGPDVPKA